MCSIIGFSGVYDRDLLTKVFENSKIRGIHSFGFSFYEAETLITNKFLDYNQFLSSIHEKAPNKFIAHFRYSTSGDYKETENNQPLSNTKTSIAFNGIISQKTKAEMEQEYNMSLQGDNDGYLLLHKMDDPEFLSSKSITFAMVGLSGGKLIAMKNAKRPLYIAEKNGMQIIASTNDILKRSGIDFAVELPNLKKITF
jgi:glutamine phosphoribosylpyrophosphate amidotransferase